MTEVRERLFDMMNDQHFLLLASGMFISSDGIGPHTSPAASDSAMWLHPNAPDTEPPPDSETELPPTDDDVYEGCGTTKICIGRPDGCIVSVDRNCELFGAVIFNENRFYFELLSKGE